MLKSFEVPATWVAGALTLTALSSAAPLALADEASNSEPVNLPGIVVVADRTATPLVEIGSSVTIITSEQIKNGQQATVAELLRTVPGLDIVASGGAGTVTSVFTRGSNSSHTLVIIDGVEMNDPSDPSGAYDFSHLRSDNIERIEVLRGAQSVLYGSNALGGVVNIITRNSQGPTSVTGMVEGGAFGSYRSGLDVNLSNESVTSTLSLTRFKSDGFSHTGSSARDENDGFEGFEISGKARARLSGSLHASVSLRYHDSQSDLDKGYESWDNPGVFDDPNYFSEATKGHERLSLNWSNLQKNLDLEFFGSHARTERYSLDLPDTKYGFSESETSHIGNRYQYGANAVAKLTKRLRLVAGVETERETLDQETFWGFGAPEAFNGSDATTDAGFLSLRYTTPDDVSFTAGFRRDDHDQFGGQNSLRFTLSAPVVGADTRLRASLGTGFKAPSVWQLYAPFFGNSALVPEENLSWDIGVDHALSKQVDLSVSVFRATFEHLFSYDPITFQTINLDSALTEGAELSLQVRGKKSQLSVDYTYTMAKDQSDGVALLRRPKNKVNVTVDTKLSKTLTGQLRVRHVGSRYDVGSLKIDPYSVADIAVTQKISENVHFNWRVENLFNEQYQEITNYNSPGLSLFGGLRISR